MKKFLSTLLLWSFLVADGVIIPLLPPTLPPRKFYLELKQHQVKIDVYNTICRVEVDEIFHNPYEVRIEGEYIFPLPKGAMPSKFSMFVDGKEVKGEVLEKNKARKIYEDIVRRTLDPALLEYYQNNLFRANIFPIPSKENRRIIIRYEMELQRKGEFYELVYPLKIEGLSPKPIQSLIINFNVKSDIPIKQVFSPTHRIDIFKEEKSAKGAYEQSNVKPDKDFILYYSLSQKDYDLSLLDYKKEGENGYFLLSLSAPAEPRKKEVLEKNIIFVLDVSGSMAGEKIEQAKEGARFFLKSLNQKDKFTIIPFSTDVSPFEKKLISPTKENIERAMNFINELSAKGGTNICSALITALSILKEEKDPSYIVFLTDGLPTVGTTAPDEIIKEVEKVILNQKIFVFGVGYDVNTILLDKIAEKGQGVAEYIEPTANLEIVLSSFYSKIMYPLLLDIVIEYKNVDVEKVLPEKLPGLFYGQSIILAGRYKKGGHSTIVLKSARKGKPFVIEESFTFSEKNEEFDFVPLIWARKRVAYLLSEIRLHGENKELVDEIVDLGTKFGIVTPYTSSLVREEERALLPMSGAVERLKSEAPGKSSFEIAKDIVKMQAEIAIETPLIESIKRIVDKTFYLRDNFYVDAIYKEGMKTEEIVFGTDEFFKLLQKNPKLAKYLSLSENMVVVFENIAYRIVKK